MLIPAYTVFLPASTTYSGTAFDYYGETDNSFIYVVSDVFGARFEAQYVAAATPALTDITRNADISLGAGSTTTGVSGHLLNSIATTQTFPFAVTDIKRNVLNDVTSVNSHLIVQANNITVGPAFGGATGQ